MRHRRENSGLRRPAWPRREACSAREEIISATGIWPGPDPATGDEEVTLAEVHINDVTESATATGGNDTEFDQAFCAVAMCLEV